MNWWEIVRFEARLLGPARGRAALWALCVAVSATCGIAAATLIGRFIDDVNAGRGLSTVAFSAIAVSSATVAATVARAVATVHVDTATARGAARLRVRSFACLQRKEVSAVSAVGFDEVYHRLTHGIERIHDAMRLFLGEFVFYCVSVVLGVVVVARIDPLIPVVCLVVYLPYIAARRPVLRRLGQHWNAHLLEYPGITTVVREAVEGVRHVKIHAAADAEGERLSRAQRRYLGAYRAHLRMLCAGGFLNHVMFLLPEGLVYLYLGARVLDGAVTVGQLSSVIGLFPCFRQFIWHVSRMRAHQGEHGIHIGRLVELDRLPDDQHGDGAATAVVGALEFRSVSVVLGGRPVLTDLSLRVRPGQRIGIVGLSGAGKSTMANLLVGLLAPDAGEVLVDGVPLADWPIDHLRRHIAYVAQDAFVLNDTIRANLGYGIEPPIEQRLHWALELADLTEFITALPDGLDTVVGERGVQLSGGQRQRLSIARAYLREPMILVLDETTSALDVESEARVRAAQNRLCDGRTSLVITHRLGTVGDADTIVVVDGGRVRERGSHGDLVQGNGLYARLFHAGAGS